MITQHVTQEMRDEALRLVAFLPPALREKVTEEIKNITYEDVCTVLKARFIGHDVNLSKYSFRVAVDYRLGLLSLLEDELCLVPNIGEKRALETIAKLERDLLRRWAQFCDTVMERPETLLETRTTRLIEVKASSGAKSTLFHWPETSAQPLMNRAAVKSLRVWVKDFYPENLP